MVLGVDGLGEGGVVRGALPEDVVDVEVVEPRGEDRVGRAQTRPHDQYVACRQT